MYPPKSLDHIVSGSGSRKSSATAFDSVYVSKLPSDSSIIASVSGFTEAGVGIFARFSGCSHTTAGVNGRECMLQIRILLGTPSVGTAGSDLLATIRALPIASASGVTAISESPRRASKDGFEPERFRGEAIKLSNARLLTSSLRCSRVSRRTVLTCMTPPRVPIKCASDAECRPNQTPVPHRGSYLCVIRSCEESYSIIPD